MLLSTSVVVRARMPEQAPDRLQRSLRIHSPLPDLRTRGFAIPPYAELALHVEVVLSLLH